MAIVSVQVAMDTSGFHEGCPEGYEFHEEIDYLLGVQGMSGDP